jgi:phage baseplate assembly protein W
MPDATKDFLGSGWKFPPRLDARGQIELVHQEQDVEEAIGIILRTNQGERPMRPEFGSELFKLHFLPNDASTAGLARRYVQEALARWEPRIEVLEVRAGPDPRTDPKYHGRLLINIQYRLRATNSQRNLVFPFYVIPGED